MTVLTKERLFGTWATLLLPIQSDNRIDYGSLQGELDFLSQSGVNGIYSNGTAGEFYNQTEAEFDAISERLASTCHKATIPFQIGASYTNPLISLERIERTKSLKPGAYQLILPDWITTNSAEQLIFLKKMAERAAPIPLILYHPGHAKTKLVPSDYDRLAWAVPELIGIKVALADTDWYAQMRLLSNRLAVFVTGHRLATGIKEKVGVGAYSNVACINPVAAQKWYQLMLEDIDEALKVETRILKFFNQCILPFHTKGYSDTALDKFLAATGGWTKIDTRLRWPYQGIDPREVAKARKAGHQLLPEFFSPN